MLQAMVASGITASRDLTKPVKRDHVERRRALAMRAIQARRGT
jgi:hypothetical protein